MQIEFSEEAPRAAAQVLERDAPLARALDVPVLERDAPLEQGPDALLEQDAPEAAARVAVLLLGPGQE